MAPRNRQTVARRDTDIGNLLTVAQKNELTLLMAAITDGMRDQITRGFDTVAATEPSGTGSQRRKAQAWCMKPTSFDQRSLRPDPKENVKDTKENRCRTETEVGGVGIISGSTPSRDEVEVLAPSLENLKKDALAAYRRWQTSVLKRVGEITVSSKDTGTQKMQAQASLVTARAAQRAGNHNKAAAKAGKNTTLTADVAGGSTKRQDVPVRPAMTEADSILLQLYWPVPTSLAILPVAKRRLLLHSMLLLLLSLENYTAYSRVLLLHMASSLQIPPHELAQDEVRVATGLAQMAKELCVEDSTQKIPDENVGRPLRRWKPGGSAGLAGAAAQTGGLAAPLEAAGVGSTLGGSVGHGAATTAGLLGAMAESAIAVGTLFGIYGPRGAGKMMDSYVRDIPDFGLLPLYGRPGSEFLGAKEISADHRRLRVVIGISGWLTDECDLSAPWRALGGQGEVHALRWDADMLAKMGCSLETVARSTAWSVARKEIAAQAGRCHDYNPLNILRNEAAPASPHGTLWPPSLLKISKIVDNPWSICLVRADKAGTVLAEAIMNRFQGERAVSLVGFSLGARVIYMCLMILAEKRALGLVESVALMGAPVPADPRVWSAMRSVVAGRLVNVYSEDDYLLGFLSRASSVQFGVAGLQCIEGQAGVENVNATALVTEHLRYQYLEGIILESLGWEDVDLVQANKDENALRLAEEKLACGRRSGHRTTIVAGAVESRDSNRSVKAVAKPEQKLC